MIMRRFLIFTAELPVGRQETRVHRGLAEVLSTYKWNYSSNNQKRTRVCRGFAKSFSAKPPFSSPLCGDRKSFIIIIHLIRRIL